MGEGDVVPVPNLHLEVHMFRTWLWSVVHNCLIHPLFPFLGHSVLEKAHDYTAEKAYPSQKRPA